MRARPLRPIPLFVCILGGLAASWGHAQEGWSLPADPPEVAVERPDIAPRRVALSSRVQLMVAPALPGDHVLLILGNDEAQVYSLSQGRAVGRIPSKTRSPDINSIALNAVGTCAAVAVDRFSSGSIDVWDTLNGKLLARLEPGAKARNVEFVEFIGNAMLATYPGKDGDHSATIWDLETGDAVRTLVTQHPLTKGVAAASPGGKYLAVAARNKNFVLIYEVATGQLVQQLTFQPGSGFWDDCHGLVFNAEGTELAGLFGHRPPKLRVWDLPKGRLSIEQPLAADPHGNLHGRPSYNGRDFQAMPDGSGWLCFGYFWVTRSNLMVSRDLRAKAGAILSTILPLGADQLAFCTPGIGQSQLVIQKLPEIPPLDQAGDHPPQWKKGDTVKLAIELKAVRHAEADSVRPGLERALTLRMKELGFIVADEAPRTLQVAYEELAGPVLKRPRGTSIRVLTPPTQFGRDDGRPGQGTGFVISPDGHIVTCAHVVGKSPIMTVKLGARKLSAKVLATDEKHDLALLKFEGKEEDHLRLRNSDAYELGEDLRAVGFPLTNVLGETLKVTKGTLSGLIRKSDRNLFMSDAATNPGNSGGPLIDQRGQVLAVSTALYVGEKIERVSLSTPINQLKPLCEREKVEWPAATVDTPAITGPDLLKHLEATIALVLPPGVETATDDDEAESTETRIELSLTAANRAEPLWTHSVADKSVSLNVQGSWNAKSLREAAFRQAENRLKQIAPPYFISADGRVQLPMNVVLYPLDAP